MQLTVLVVFLFHVMGFISAAHAVMSTRTPQGAIAWTVSLVTFPYIAVPAYWVFGRNRFHGYTTARRGTVARTAAIGDKAFKATQQFHVHSGEVDQAFLAAQELVGIPFLSGNSLELLIDGDATFADIFKGIETAQDYILFQFFIVHDDMIGREVKRRLMAKAKEGVRVHFLYDEVGSKDLPKSYLQDLRDAGVEAFNFHTRKGPRNRLQINFRNHRKVVVFDGKQAWIGGHNVGDEYLGKSPKFGHWRDTHIRIEGPAVLSVQLAFAEDWHWATDKQLDAVWTPTPAAKDNIPVLILPTGPADTMETANLMFVHAINSAKKRIWITSPYFIPDPPVVTALQLAGLRGLDVRILIPDSPDHIGAYLAAFTYLQDAEQTGVTFHRYQEGFLHQKVMLIDDSVATVGTANFDNRSFRLNFEITALIQDADFAAQIQEMLEADFAKSRQMEPDAYKGKPWWFKVAAQLARLTAPVQ